MNCDEWLKEHQKEERDEAKLQKLFESKKKPRRSKRGSTGEKASASTGRKKRARKAPATKPKFKFGNKSKAKPKFGSLLASQKSQQPAKRKTFRNRRKKSVKRDPKQPSVFSFVESQ